MENKTTTELLDILREDGSGTVGEYDADKAEAAFEELKKRSPFWYIFDEDWEEGIPALWSAVKELQDEVKKLRRHKHDQKTDDVMIRL